MPSTTQASRHTLNAVVTAHFNVANLTLGVAAHGLLLLLSEVENPFKFFKTTVSLCSVERSLPIFFPMGCYP